MTFYDLKEGRSVNNKQQLTQAVTVIMVGVILDLVIPSTQVHLNVFPNVAIDQTTHIQ